MSLADETRSDVRRSKEILQKQIAPQKLQLSLIRHPVSIGSPSDSILLANLEESDETAKQQVHYEQFRIGEHA
jgi:hypothetical protein